MHQADPAWFPWTVPTGWRHVVIQFITWNETSGSMCACIRVWGACAKNTVPLIPLTCAELNQGKSTRCFILALTFRSRRHLYSRIQSLKKGQRFQVRFWRGGFFMFGSGIFLVFFLNCLGNSYCKEQATDFPPSTRRSKAFCFCHWNKDT